MAEQDGEPAQKEQQQQQQQNGSHERLEESTPETTGTYLRLRLNLKSTYNPNENPDYAQSAAIQLPLDQPTKFNEKPVLLLDLDGTLVMTTNNRELVNSLRTPDFTFWLIDELTFGYRRPHVEEFLIWCNQHFQVYLWTAAHGTYAQLVMECLAQLIHDYELSQDSSFGEYGQELPSSEIWDTPATVTAEEGSFVVPRIEHLGDRVVSRQFNGSKVGSRRPSTVSTELSRKVSVVHERKGSLCIESYTDGELTKTEEVLKNDGEVSESGLVHPLTHNDEVQSLTYYEEAEIHSRNSSRTASRIASREPSFSGYTNGSAATTPNQENLPPPLFTFADFHPTSPSVLDGPEIKLPIPVIKIFDKNDCFIDWHGAGAWVTKNLHDLSRNHFPGVPLHNFVVIDNDPHTFNRNREHAIPIETYWGSTNDDELLHIMAFLRDTYLPCEDHSLLDLQLFFPETTE